MSDDAKRIFGIPDRPVDAATAPLWLGLACGVICKEFEPCSEEYQVGVKSFEAAHFVFDEINRLKDELQRLRKP